MIPLDRYSRPAADQLLQYLIVELDKAQSSRKPLEQKWMRYQRLYRMEPEVVNKNFPFEHCSNVVVGLAANNVDIVSSRLMAMLWTPPNLWSATAWRPELEDFAPRVDEFMQWAQSNELEAYNAVRDWILEICKLGTSVLKTRYHREMRKVFDFREILDPMSGQVQTIQQQSRKIITDCPKLHHVSIVDFFVPPTANTLVDAPWCAERINLTWGQIVNRVNAGIYTNTSALAPWRANSRGSEYEQFMQKLDSYQASLGDKFETFEFWLDWDIDGDGEQEALVTTIHKDSRTMLRLDFNPFFNQEKPYDVGRYLAQEKRFHGIGLCEMVDPYQDEVSTMHNQRIDNKTVANAMVVIALKNGNIKQGEPIFPGRVLLVDDIDEIKMQSMGTVTDSTVEDEAVTMNLAEQRTGTNDFIAADTSNPSTGYSSATTAVQQLREGAKRFDQVYREIRTPLGSAGLRILELYQQFNQGGKPYMALGQKDGQMVQQILNFPLELIRAGMGVNVTATSAAFNKDVQIRTNTIILQMLTQFYGQIMQAEQIFVNPSIPPIMRLTAAKAIQGGVTLMDRILSDYGEQDTSKLLPDLTELFGGQPQQPQQPAFAGAGPGPGFGPPQQAGSGIPPVGSFPPPPFGMATLPNGPGGIAGYMPAQAGAGGGPQGPVPFAR